MEENELQNIVYRATCAHFEWLESKCLYSGNGHHLAQKVCEKVWDRYVIEKPHLLETRKLEEITNKLNKLHTGISVFFTSGAVKPDKELLKSVNVTIEKTIKELKELQK